MLFKEFLSLVEKNCKDYNIELVVGDQFVSDSEGNKSNGFFDASKSLERPLLAYSAGFDESIVFPLVVHEYNHMQQYLENSDIWNSAYLTADELKLFNYSENDDKDTYDVLFSWIDRKIELTPTQLDDIIYRCINVELDCEKRTIQMIKDFNLNIDVDDYIQNALSYLYFYQYLKISRKWYPTGNAPYQIKSIYSKMPNNFDDLDILQPMNQDWISIYENGFKENGS